MAEAAVKTLSVPAEHPVFRGHFPGNPIVPGVMLLEWVLDEAGTMLARPPASLRVREAKFFTPLAPAQRAELHLEPGALRCAFHIHRDQISISSGILEWDADE